MGELGFPSLYRNSDAMNEIIEFQWVVASRVAGWIAD
jgi:hypothetical protein